MGPHENESNACRRHRFAPLFISRHLLRCAEDSLSGKQCSGHPGKQLSEHLIPPDSFSMPDDTAVMHGESELKIFEGDL